MNEALNNVHAFLLHIFYIRSFVNTKFFQLLDVIAEVDKSETTTAFFLQAT